MIHTAERFVEKQAAFEAALATCRAIDFLSRRANLANHSASVIASTEPR
jgi:hypothetical protein